MGKGLYFQNIQEKKFEKITLSRVSNPLLQNHILAQVVVFSVVGHILLHTKKGDSENFIMCMMVGGNHDSALSGKNHAIMNDHALKLLIIHSSHQKIVVSHFLLSPYSHMHVVCDKIYQILPFFCV